MVGILFPLSRGSIFIAPNVKAEYVIALSKYLLKSSCHFAIVISDLK